jgi:hypothetical protein
MNLTSLKIPNGLDTLDTAVMRRLSNLQSLSCHCTRSFDQVAHRIHELPQLKHLTVSRNPMDEFFLSTNVSTPHNDTLHLTSLTLEYFSCVSVQRILSRPGMETLTYVTLNGLFITSEWAFEWSRLCALECLVLRNGTEIEWLESTLHAPRLRRIHIITRHVMQRGPHGSDPVCVRVMHSMLRASPTIDITIHIPGPSTCSDENRSRTELDTFARTHYPHRCRILSHEDNDDDFLLSDGGGV